MEVKLRIYFKRGKNKLLLLEEYFSFPIYFAHYAKLKEMPPSPNHYEKLRMTFDSIEKHLRSLEALDENIEKKLDDVFAAN